MIPESKQIQYFISRLLLSLKPNAKLLCDVESAATLYETANMTTSTLDNLSLRNRRVNSHLLSNKQPKEILKLQKQINKEKNLNQKQSSFADNMLEELKQRFFLKFLRVFKK